METKGFKTDVNYDDLHGSVCAPADGSLKGYDGGRLELLCAHHTTTFPFRRKKTTTMSSILFEEKVKIYTLGNQRDR